jgi:hypothetical protein
LSFSGVRADAWTLPLCSSCALLATSGAHDSLGNLIALVEAREKQTAIRYVSLMKIRANGNTEWTWPNADDRFSVGTASSSQLWLVPGSFIVIWSYLSANSTYLFAFSTDLGATPGALWKTSFAFESVSIQVSSDSVVLVSADSTVHRHNPFTGDLYWSTDLPSATPGTAPSTLALFAPAVCSSTAPESPVELTSAFAVAAAAGSSFQFDRVHVLVNDITAGTSLFVLNARTGLQTSITRLRDSPLSVDISRPSNVQMSVDAHSGLVVLIFGSNCSTSCLTTSALAFFTSNNTVLWRRDWLQRPWSTSFEFDWRARLLIGSFDGDQRQLAAISLDDGMFTWRLATVPLVSTLPTLPANITSSTRLSIRSLDARNSPPQLQQSVVLAGLDPRPVDGPRLLPDVAAGAVLCSRNGLVAAPLFPASAGALMSALSFAMYPTDANPNVISWISVAIQSGSAGNALIGVSGTLSSVDDSLSQCFLSSTWCSAPPQGTSSSPVIPDSFAWYDISNWSLVRRACFVGVMAASLFSTLLAAFLGCCRQQSDTEFDLVDDGVDSATFPDQVDQDQRGFDPAAIAAAATENAFSIDDESDVVELVPPKLKLYEEEE